MKISLPLLICLLCCTFARAQNTAPKKAASHSPVPNFDSLYRGTEYRTFNLTTLEGKEVNNKNIKDKVTVLNFWFESCPGCMGEVAEVNELYRRLKNDPKCEFIAVTFDGTASLSGFIQKHGMNYPIATTGDSKMASQLNYGMGYPSLIVIDKEGKIALIGAYALSKGETSGRYNITIDKVVALVKGLE